MSGINEAIKQAQNAAGDLIDGQNLPATQPATQTGQVVPFQKPTMETMANSTGISKSVDSWLKVQADGLKVDNLKGLVDEIEVEIDMTEDQGFFVKQSVKWGNPVVYASTYDGLSSDKGGAWSDQVAKVQTIDPQAKVFPSADIIAVVTKAVKFKDGNVEAGTKLGHTLSMSNWGEWTEFYREVAKAGLIGKTVKVKLVAEEVNGKNGYTWGVVKFKLAA